MTLRLPAGVRRGVDRLAAQLGHKPAQVGARLIDEGLRRRDFPQIELRDTVAGRVAYIQGTRIAVYWVVQRINDGMTIEEFGREHDVPTAPVNAALAYSEVFRQEIERDLEDAAANQRWIEAQESAWRAGHRGHSRGRSSSRSSK